MRATRVIRIVGGVAVAGTLIAVAVWPETTQVDFAPVAQSDLQVTIDQEGETRVRERFVVTASVGGRLRRVEIEPGEPVRQGQAILFLAPPSAPLLDPRTRMELEEQSNAAIEAVGQARADRDRAVAMLDRTATTERRLSNLVEVGGVSREDYDASRAAQISAATALRAAEHALARAERERDAAGARLLTPGESSRVITVRSPSDGVVLKRLRESEASVAPGDPLVEIGDPRQIEIVADLLSTDAVRVKEGAPVSIERWGGPQHIQGHVRRVEPSGFTKVSALGVEEQRVNVIVAIDKPEAAATLGDGYRVDVRIEIARADGAVTVPVGALFRHGGQWSVFVGEGGRARLRPVEIGERNDMVAQVVGGLAIGEHVIIHPPDTLVDGSRIGRRSEP